MKTKKNASFAAVIGLGALILTMAWTVFAGNGGSEQNAVWPPDLGPRLDGAWIIAAPSPLGGKIFHACFLTAQDADGLRYTVVMKHSECTPTVWGNFPEATKKADMVGMAEKIGPITVKGTQMGYGVKEGELEEELIYIQVASYEGTLIDENTLELTATQSFYLPEQDANGDGFPDEGQLPVLCTPYSVPCRRVTLVPMCEPTPPPEPPQE